MNNRNDARCSLFSLFSKNPKIKKTKILKAEPSTNRRNSLITGLNEEIEDFDDDKELRHHSIKMFEEVNNRIDNNLGFNFSEYLKTVHDLKSASDYLKKILLIFFSIFMMFAFLISGININDYQHILKIAEALDNLKRGMNVSTTAKFLQPQTFTTSPQ